MTVGETRRVRVEGELTILTAAEQKDRLLDALHDGVDVRLDLAGVSEIDTAGLQVLLLVQREAARREHTAELVAASPPVAEVLDLARIGPAGPLPLADDRATEV